MAGETKAVKKVNGKTSSLAEGYEGLLGLGLFGVELCGKCQDGSYLSLFLHMPEGPDLCRNRVLTLEA